MAYRQIDERFWKDKKVKTLDKDCYLLFLYLLTSPHTHFSGLTEMTLGYIVIDTPLSEKECIAAFKKLEAAKMIVHDSVNDLIWIVNMAKYQVKSEKQITGAKNHIERLPKSKLVFQFCDRYQIPYPYPTDTLLNQNNTPPIQVNMNTTINTDEIEPTKKSVCVDYSDQVAEFWETYPKKEAKVKAVEKLKTILKRGVLFEDIMIGLEGYLQSDEVKRGFIMQPTRWLNEERWTDEKPVTNGGKELSQDQIFALEESLGGGNQ